MDHFTHQNGQLHAEDVPLEDIAEAVGTPVYVYSAATFRRHAQVFRQALSNVEGARVVFAVKANPNLAVLKLLASEGYGADVVSGGEMRRALAAGIPASDIIFSGVGKTRAEMESALDVDLGQFNIESIEEGRELAALATERGQIAKCCLRINPDVDAKTHEKISTGKSENKFGVPLHLGAEIYAALAEMDGLDMRGFAIHIGSQVQTLEPFETAFRKIGALVEETRAAGGTVTHVDLGGGLGVPHKESETFPSPAEYGAMVARETAGWNVHLMFEPGRVIAGNAGILLTRVIRVKEGGQRPFVIVDAAMNDLARPALYGAWHDFAAVKPSGERFTAHIVGPICETGDTFARDRECDQVAAGDLAIFRTVGAYGATMASSYNSRGFVPEVLVEGDKFAIVAHRIDASDILDAERIPDWLD